jgi:hypothetical protein
MQKILFICDGDNFPKGAFQFIKHLNEQEHIFVKGIFFTAVDYEELIPVSYMAVGEPYVKFKENEKRIVQKSEERFAAQCESAHIKHCIYGNMESWDRDLFAKESRFADLAVISEQLFCSNYFTGDQPNYFMQEALRSSECPVMVVPEVFKIPGRLALAYDGKKESMFAIKQFARLFPQFTDLPSEFVYIKNEVTDDIPDHDLLDEYASLHFNSHATSKLHFDSKKVFPTWLEDKPNVLLVTGSYSRSDVSNFLDRSFADPVIHDRTCPVFVAHYN